MATFNSRLFIHFSPLKSRLLLKYRPCHHYYYYSSSFSLHFTSLYHHPHHTFSTSTSNSFMEVVKAIAKQGSAASNSIAVRAGTKSYSYRQVILSAQKISSLLCTSASHSISEAIQREHTSVPVDDSKAFSFRDGIRVGIVAKPSAEFVASVLGIWLSGGVAVPLALSYPEAELLHVMKDSDVSMVLSTEDHRELMQTIATKTAAQFSLIPPVTSITPETEATADGHSESGGSNLNALEMATNIEGANAALVIYTSGTTGKPKGVIHTHQSVLAQVQMLKEAWGYSCSDQFLHCLPLHHVHGLFNALLAPLYAGATVEFMPKFSVSGIWQRWRESYPTDGTHVDSAITVFTGVPTMYTRLIQGYEAMQPDVQVLSASAASKLRLMMCGSSALPYPVMQQWETITDHRLLERYGMTEFVMALSNPLQGLRKGGTVGKPLPGVEVKIIAEDDSGDSTDVGELCVKSPSLFREYWKLPEVTRSSFTDDGFFKTGDAVTVDEDGYFIILGRTSADIMKVGGYKLSALEIEAILLEHPAVSECCVLGLPDKTYGEAVCAIIVPREEIKKKRKEELKPTLTLEELVSWAKEKLAPYKLPTQLYIWESLPRNAMGKVNKKELKKLLVSESQ